jgi:glycosyltransferase involved in cell wall biosynthesis
MSRLNAVGGTEVQLMNVPISHAAGRSTGLAERWDVDEAEALEPMEAAVAADVVPLLTRMAVRGAVSLVVPARNEAANIGWVLNRIPDCVDEVILVDGESTDATLEMARATLPSLRIVPQQGPGKGNALRTGFLAAKGEYIVMIDADGSMSPREIPRYIHFLESGFDLVKGSRFTGGGGSLDITTLRRMGNRGLLALVNMMYQSTLTDLCYGYVAFNRAILDQLDLQSSGFEIETEIVVRALLAGLRVAEVPTLELPRRTGQSNLRTFRDGHRVLRTLLRERNGRPLGAAR